MLYRSNAQSRVIENQFFSAGVPYRVYGGQRFFERAEVKHALAYLRLIDNPNDDTSYLRVVNFPPRGIGARSVEQLQDAARAANGGAGSSLYAAVGQVGGAAGTKLGAFNAFVDVLREETAGLTLREIIEVVLERSGLFEHYKKEREGEDRIENLHELVNAAEAFVTVEGFGRDAVALPAGEPAAQEVGLLAPDGSAAADAVDADPFDATGETLSPLEACLSHASLEAGDTQAQSGQDAIQLMTVHAAKGLEFDCVFITGLEEGLFPHENALADAAGLEEERRLMYVAVTRARQRLYLSFAQTRMLHGQTRYNIRSRFFEELPEGALKWLTPPGGMRSGGYAASDWDAAWAAAGSSRTRETEPAPATRTAGAYRVGMRVFHNKFGEGTLVTLEGSGPDAKAQINFGRHGLKWLALGIAKLTPIDE